MIRDRLPWAILVAALLLPVVLVLGQWRNGTGRRATETLADYGVVPDFSLVERSGQPVRRSDLAGSPWIANFVYTRCSGSCPLVSAAMAKLQQRVENGVRLVSFSVDPSHDTPAVLAEFAERFKASRDRWWFLTGDVAALRRLVSEGFHLSVSEEAEGDPGEAITHSDRIVLVDRDLRIRRYYSGETDGWIEEAVRDLRGLGTS